MNYKVGDYVIITKTNLSYFRDEFAEKDVGRVAKIVSFAIGYHYLLEFDKPYPWTHDGHYREYGISKRRFYQESMFKLAIFSSFPVENDGKRILCDTWNNRVMNICSMED